MSTGPPTHTYALLTPWYANEPERHGSTAALIERPRRSLLQKYDSSEFAAMLLRDPSDSLAWADEDQWSFPVVVPRSEREQLPAGSPLRLASHRMAPSGLRKLYQPSHKRFYALTTELSCDEFGLPRPSSTVGLMVRFVMRRIRYEIVGASQRDVRRAARELTGTSDLGYRPGMTRAQRAIIDREATEMVSAGGPGSARGVGGPGGPVLAGTVLAGLDVVRHEEAWITEEDGSGRWVEVTDRDDLIHDDLPEEEQPMWAIPPSEVTACTATKTRSIWFGVPRTASDESDPAGNPKLDDRHIYELRCFVRAQDPEQPECVDLYWGDGSEAFRLAPFFDPQGSKNRRINVKLPDLRTLAAQAGQPSPSGGVVMETPPGSGLMFDADGSIEINGPSIGAENCSFSIELFTIVAMFVFSLFLPIVVFVFQLWWLLSLRFCWLFNIQAMAQLEAYFAVSTSLPGGVGPHPQPTDSDQLAEFELAVDVYGTAATGETSQPTAPPPGQPLPDVDDPLCQEA